MKLTPNDVASLKDTSKWENFTYEEENLGNGQNFDDGSNF
jgi:hypothetical protein